MVTFYNQERGGGVVDRRGFRAPFPLSLCPNPATHVARLSEGIMSVRSRDKAAPAASLSYYDESLSLDDKGYRTLSLRPLPSPTCMFKHAERVRMANFNCPDIIFYFTGVFRNSINCLKCFSEGWKYERKFILNNVRLEYVYVLLRLPTL